MWVKVVDERKCKGWKLGYSKVHCLLNDSFESNNFLEKVTSIKFAGLLSGDFFSIETRLFSILRCSWVLTSLESIRREHHQVMMNNKLMYRYMYFVSWVRRVERAGIKYGPMKTSHNAQHFTQAIDNSFEQEPITST